MDEHNITILRGLASVHKKRSGRKFPFRWESIPRQYKSGSTIPQKCVSMCVYVLVRVGGSVFVWVYMRVLACMDDCVCVHVYACITYFIFIQPLLNH